MSPALAAATGAALFVVICGGFRVALSVVGILAAAVLGGYLAATVWLVAHPEVTASTPEPVEVVR